MPQTRPVSVALDHDLAPRSLGVERRSIGYIPKAERYGRPLNQFTLWFGANLQVTALVTGALAVVLGGDVVWSLCGLCVGQLLGGAVMALHAAQGPRLGMPQMISSRAQFGVYGAMVPLVLVVVMYVGFAASSAVLAGQAVAGLLHAAHWIGILIFGGATTIIAIVGYRLIHIMGRINSAVGSIAYRPYVADYSRYLPAETPAWQTFLASMSGSVLSSQLAMTFGVFAAGLAGPAFSGNEIGFIVALGGTGFSAALLFGAIAFGKLTINVLNAYGGFMSLVTTITGFFGSREISKRARISAVTLIMALATLIALLASRDFLSVFSTFVLLLLTFFTPWSAINLVDFYFVSKERYDVPALLDLNGRYGRWNYIALTTYFVGLLAQLPFLYSSIYQGPMVRLLGHTDISWIVGLVVPGAMYFVWARRDRSHLPRSAILPDDRL